MISFKNVHNEKRQENNRFTVIWNNYLKGWNENLLGNRNLESLAENNSAGQWIMFVKLKIILCVLSWFYDVFGNNPNTSIFRMTISYDGDLENCCFEKWDELLLEIIMVHHK